MSKTTLTIDDLMEQLALAEAELNQYKADADREVQEIKAKLQADSAQAKKLVDSLKRKIRTRAKKANEKKDQSFHKTPFGTVAVRRNPPELEVEDEKKTLRLLRDGGHHKYIRVYEEPDKEAMAGESELFLTSVGIRRKQGVTVNIKVEHVTTPKAD